MGLWVHIFSSVFFLGLLFPQGFAVLEEDKRALLDFLSNFSHFRYLNWVENNSVCSYWTGVTCNEDGSRVIAVRLPRVGFQGPIPVNTLSRLSELQILSLRSNGISGPFPPDLYSLKNLSYLYLQFNKFSGPLPLNFSVWKNLTSVNLSNNGFNGSIPHSLTNLTHLIALNIANNAISGDVPDLYLPSLQQLNFSNNKLVGIVPKSLGKFPNSAFFGNNVSLAGNSPIVVSSSHQQNSKSKRVGRLSEAATLEIVIAGSVFGLIGVVLVWLVWFLRRRDEEEDLFEFEGKLGKGGMTPEKRISRSHDANNRLFFFEGCNYAFDLEDLLRASAELLGKGTFGMAYKAILEDSDMVVVKRLKEVSVGKREFEQQMEVVGSIKHENVIELRAYYYSKDEKLLVYDYYYQGSFAAMLHGMFLTSVLAISPC